MTINQLQREVNDALRKANCTVTCPVHINNRLHRTLGQAVFRRFANQWLDVKIEFSGSLIRNATEKSIRDVLLHEVAHVVANYRTGKDEGHGKVFKAVCRELGTANDKTSTAVEYKTNVTTAAKPISKYEVVCPNCGVIARYHRACKVTKNIDRCGCRKCGSFKVSLKENW